ncbi:MAG: NUDIX hydrolase [Actinobacteria bacterium]|nr:MAG: NUDIX hydrolase [Actinomycetota bacterium]
MVTPVRAAGGVVWRPAAHGVEICLVHRPRYDDWSLPKGKLEAGEHPLVAAVREVGEEAGLRGVPQVHLGTVSYTTRDGTRKTVDYWSMRGREEAGLAIAGEVDAVCWLPPASAARQVTYPHDAQILKGFAELPAVTAVVTLVRHGLAAEQGWPGVGDAAPLDAAEIAEAQAFAAVQALTQPQRLVSASPQCCVHTLSPLARRLDLPVEIDSAFDAPAPGADSADHGIRAAARLKEFAAAGVSAAICGQGGVIPDVLARLTGTDRSRFATGKGWLLAFSGDTLVAIDQIRCDRP